MPIDQKPDLIVGVDLGQTCTGIAYNFPSHGSSEIRWINKWPGRAQANENKVPTILVYPHGHTQPSSWGFRAESKTEHNRDHGQVREWFKTWLDPMTFKREMETLGDVKTRHEHVRGWYSDFLKELYAHVASKLAAEMGNFAWERANVEFLFSVPTTWAPDVVEMFRDIIYQAGFTGPANANHTVTLSLTEPEAAAVHTSTMAHGIFREGDVLLVCDAGGGTTDVSVLQVIDTMSEALSLKQLKQLLVVGGENVGSAAIDFEFEQLALRNLQDADRISPLDVDLEETAWNMARSRDFLNTKCDHGAPGEMPEFIVPIESLRQNYENKRYRIQHSGMTFKMVELRSIFDRQIEKLFRMIDNQLVILANKMPHTNVSHLVLSGGLGQSTYVQTQLGKRYGAGYGPFENARTMQVRVAPDPQMAVSKGLVADRLRKLKAGQGVLGWRCCRGSYGTICKELYSKNNPQHIGREIMRDPRDKQLYILDCIDWFVEKGSPVSIDHPIIHRFKRKVNPGDPRRIFPTKIVVSYLDKPLLPSHLEEGKVEKLCEVESDLSAADETRFKEKNKAFWKPGEHFFEVTYEVRVVIGPADLRFELWFDGRKLSKENSINVEWAPSRGPSIANMQPAPVVQRPLIEEDGILKRKRPGGMNLRRMLRPTAA